MRTANYNWWAWGLRGVLAMTFGLTALVWPSLTLYLLLMLFATYAVVGGIILMAAAIGPQPPPHWKLLILDGVLGIVTGIGVWLWPNLSAIALLFVIAGWSIVTGVIEVGAAIVLRREVKNEWLLALSGMLSIIFGVLLALQPAAGLLTLVWLVGLYALIFGLTLVGLALRLLRLPNKQSPSLIHQ